MRRRLRQRLLQAAALLAVVAAGAWGYLSIVRPDRGLLERLARQNLEEILGPDVAYEHVEIDPVHGVTIRNLRVHPPRAPEPTLVAGLVVIEHDLLALVSGTYRPERIQIADAVLWTHETETGIGLDFPFHLTSSGGSQALPEIMVVRSAVKLRAREDSARLRTRTLLELTNLSLSLQRAVDGTFAVAGGFDAPGLGQRGRMGISGHADAAADRVDVTATWTDFTITEPLLQQLAEDVAGTLRGQRDQRGTLTVHLARDPEEAQGEVQFEIGWAGAVRMNPGALPDPDFIAASGFPQVRALLDRAQLVLKVRSGEMDIESLVGGLGSGEVKAAGSIKEDGESLNLWIGIEDLRLDDPALREALGEEGRAIFAEFEPTGRVSADLYFRKEKGQELDWWADAYLSEASLRYVGSPGDDGLPGGFPYRVENASAWVRITPGLVRLMIDVEGQNLRSNPPADVRILGNDRTAWTGGPTGQIVLGDGEPEIRLTVVASNVPVDEELFAAEGGSEFAGILEQLGLSGILDRIEVDIIRKPDLDDAAVPEVRIDLRRAGFRYEEFPLPLTDVGGRFTLRRPERGDGTRGKIFRFDVEGRADGATVKIGAEFEPDDDRGRIHVEADGVALSGPLTRAVLEAPATREGLAEVWRFLDPRGRADVTADLPLSDDPRPISLKVQLRDASMRLDAAKAPAPLEITGLSGEILVEGDLVRLVGLRGRIHDAGVEIEGRIEGGTDGRWDVHVRTAPLRVDPDLVAAIEHLAGGTALLPEGLLLESGGRFGLEVHLRREPGAGQEIQADVTATDLDATIRLPEGTYLALRGERITVRGPDVRILGIRAEAPGILVEALDTLATDGEVTGRFILTLTDFQASEGLLALAGEEVEDLLGPWIRGRSLSSKRLELEMRPDGGTVVQGDLVFTVPPGAPIGDGPLGQIDVRPLRLSPADREGRRTLSGRLVFQGFSPGASIPVRDVDGTAEVEALRLGDEPEGRFRLRIREARVADVRVADLDAPVDWQGGILRAERITGLLAEGRLRARFLLHTRAPEAYEGEVAVDEFQLESIRTDLAPTGPPFRGTGHLRFQFENRGGSVRDLTGVGHVRVRRGHLGDMPLVANVFAFLANLAGDETPPSFERLDAQFTLRDEVLHFDQLDLAGPLFEMPGRGTVDLGGLVDLVFTPDFIKSFALPGVMQLPGLGDVLDALLREDLLYAVRLRGDASTASPEIVVLPPLGLDRDPPFEGTGLADPPPRRIPRWFR